MARKRALGAWKTGYPERVASTETILASLTAAGIEADTIEACPSATIVPHVPKRVLPGLGRDDLLSSQDRLELRETIGEGGMGIVRLGVQRALGRDVAVKTLKPDHHSDEAALKLLREAWITGMLEHPNIVPVSSWPMAGAASTRTTRFWSSTWG